MELSSAFYHTSTSVTSRGLEGLFVFYGFYNGSADHFSHFTAAVNDSGFPTFPGLDRG